MSGESMTQTGLGRGRLMSFVAGSGMMAASALTIGHFFEANYPRTVFQGAFCDISAFFNCDSSAYSPIAQVLGVPLGVFGLVVGFLVALGAVLPSPALEKTNASLALLNVLGVVGLLLYSVLVLGSLCLLCSGYYLFSIFSFLLFAARGKGRGLAVRFLRPSIKLLAVMAAVTLAVATGFREYHDVRREAQTGNAWEVVKRYYELPTVKAPSLLSPYWTVKSTEEFTAAPIQVVEYVDFLCPDCLYLARQLETLKGEFKGKINIAFQFFPLEAECNSVVDKNLHPGACELSYMAARRPEKFAAIHDEIFANFRAAKDPAWRRGLARRHGVEDALDHRPTRELVERIIRTGSEYEKTSDRYAHGIRSTPTMILNNRLIIGTLPIEHLRAIFRALVDEREGGRKFIENWVPLKKSR